jgi:hypothetical protein
VDWIDLVQDRDRWRALVNTVTNLPAPYNVGKFLSTYATGGFSRRAQLHGNSFIYICAFRVIFTNFKHCNY